jgi:hypothetical protein
MDDQVVRLAAWLREMPVSLLVEFDSVMQGVPLAPDVPIGTLMWLLTNELDIRVENGWGEQVGSLSD